ncbi:MAG: hypothetical protein ACTHOO_03750 [Alcanivorax sp.]
MSQQELPDDDYGISSDVESVSKPFHNKSGALCQRLPIERVLETQDEARDHLKDLLIDLVKEVSANSGSCDFILGPNKDYNVAKNKANRDYNGDMARVTDFVRAKIVVTSPEQIEDIKKLMSGKPTQSEQQRSRHLRAVDTDTPQRRPAFMQKHNSHVARATDFFEDPKDFTGYRCLNYKLAIPVGVEEHREEEFQVVELQIVAEQIEDVYDQTHPYKRAAEAILDKDDLDAVDRRSAAYNFAACRYYNGLAARDAGYDKLLKPELRSKVALTRNREIKLRGMIDELDIMSDEDGLENN